MGSICLHCFVSGRVQGVFFRRETLEQAVIRGINGWVRNLEDGRVEVLLCGEKEAVESMRDWLWEGPLPAKVNNVESKEIPYQILTKFEVR